ncbi:hypothetical protein HDV00_011899 [Rhizophlyctis rosea]|nr:hypothetical protein HDV00_011899 [Rhizophlyctis rosea]
MFRKLSMNFPRNPRFGLDDAAEALERAWSMYRQLTFEWIIVDRPFDGTIFIFQLNYNEPIPDDGYGWMDDEMVQLTYVGNKQVEIATRKGGFAFGDQFISMTRTRYRIANSELHLMHYAELPQNARLAVNPNAARKYPRNPADLSHNQTPAHTQTTVHTHPTMDIPHKPSTSTGAPPRKTELSRKRQRATKTVARTIEDENEPSGDELDESVESLVALERYKRNHEFIDQIFSPYSIVGLDTSQEKANDEDIASMKEQVEALRKECAEMEAQRKAEKEQIGASAKSVWRAIEEVKRAKLVEEVDQLEAQFAESLGATLRPYNSGVEVVPITQ